MELNRSYAEGFHVTFAIGEALPGARVLADSDRLIQVLTNMLSNAAKYSSNGDVVTVDITEREGQMVRVSVIDRGPGIPPELRGSIFEKFTRADATDPRHKGGTGLGLSISKAIIEKLNGRIDFMSVPGRTIFFFELWQAPPAVITEQAPERIERHASAGKTS